MFRPYRYCYSALSGATNNSETPVNSIIVESKTHHKLTHDHSTTTTSLPRRKVIADEQAVNMMGI